MDNTQRGKLILSAVPAGEPEQKVVMLLSKFAKSASTDALTEKVRNTPYTISSNIEAEKAVMIIEAFQKCGATAVFMPHATDQADAEEPAPVQRPFDEPDVEEHAPIQKRFDESDDEEPTTVQRPPVFSFESDASFIDEATPAPIHVKPQKNSVRRLTMILVFILLLLSLGFLTWQLWPIIGDKIQEWITFLKHNI